MKSTKLFLALAVAVLLGACANKEAQETQYRVTSYSFTNFLPCLM